MIFFKIPRSHKPYKRFFYFCPDLKLTLISTSLPLSPSLLVSRFLSGGQTLSSSQMVTDSWSSVGTCGSMNGGFHVLPDLGFSNGVNYTTTTFEEDIVSMNVHRHVSVPLLPPDQWRGKEKEIVVGTFAISGVEGDSHEDYDFSDVVLSYISQMLMEEDMEEKNCMFQESAALQAAEKSFYEVIGKKYPPSLIPKNYPPSLIPSSCSPNSSADQNYRSQTENCSGNSFDEYTSRLTSSSSINSSNCGGKIIDASGDSSVSSIFGDKDLLSESEYAIQFKKGLDETAKFLPIGFNLLSDLRNDELSMKESKKTSTNGTKKVEDGYSVSSSRGRKNSHPADVDLDGRSNKQSAVCHETAVSSELFDRVLLCCGANNESALREELQQEASMKLQQEVQHKASIGRKARGKQKKGKGNTVDLGALLTLCAEAVAANDHRNSMELLKQIRQHSSSTGDGMQRVAHYFANGLEARLAGSGTEIYKGFIRSTVSAADILKAYHLFLAVCPFRKLSNFFSNKTIMELAENKTSIHIIDFGILYGFQWPCLIQRLSSRPGGPPKLRITGIDFPQPGFKPAERVEETGNRLSNYAKQFNVPFEYIAIAKKWENIQMEDLKIESDDVLVVNCLFRFRNLLDDTVVVESPRDAVLKLIRKINPDVFIQGIVNGAYSAPFFITRFRQALFHFCSLFDMLETVIPREKPERLLIEKEIFGREAMNVVACEGCERIERPETYKQWHVRNRRIGFSQLPLNREIMELSKDRVKSCYNKDFVIDEDSQWMLQGWKGRITYAMSCWRAAD